MKAADIKDFNRLSPYERYLYKKKMMQAGKLTANSSNAQVSAMYNSEKLVLAGYDPNKVGNLNNFELVNTIERANLAEKLLKDREVSEELLPLLDLFPKNQLLASKLFKDLFDNGYLTNSEIKERSKKSLNGKEGDEGEDWKHSLGNWADEVFGGLLSHTGGWYHKGEYGLGKDKDPKLYDKFAFNDYYNETKDLLKLSKLFNQLSEEEQERLIKEQARAKYLEAQNTNIFNQVIKPLLDKYDLEQANKVTPLEFERLKGQRSDLVYNEFYKIANGYSEEIPTAYGTETIEHQGSNWFKAFGNGRTKAFNEFDRTQLERIIAGYNAYKKTAGELKALEWLDKELQSWVANHRSWDEAALDIVGGALTNVGIIPLEFITSMAGLTAGAAGWITSLGRNYDNGVSDYLRDMSNRMLLGKDLQGNDVYVPDNNDMPGLFWLSPNYWANMKNLHDISTYHNWNPERIKEAKEFGGINKDALYTVDPYKGEQWWHSFADASDMVGLAIGLVGMAYLTGGMNNLGTNAIRQLSKKEAIQQLLRELAGVTFPIAGAYSIGNAELTFETLMSQSDNMAYKEAMKKLNELNGYSNDSQDGNVKLDALISVGLLDPRQQGLTPYLKEREEKIEEFLSKSEITQKNLAKAYSEEERQAILEEAKRELRELYDRKMLDLIYENLKKEREEGTKKIAVDAAMTTFVNDFMIESVKYASMNMAFNTWKMTGNSRKILQEKMNMHTYGSITSDPTGKLIDKGNKVNVLGKEKYLKGPKKIAAYEAVKSAAVGGGFSNFTDDLASAYATGIGLHYGNSELLREYDPEAYALTWYAKNRSKEGDNGIPRFLKDVYAGVGNALSAHWDGAKSLVDMLGTEQPYNSFKVGFIGSFYGQAFIPRIATNPTDYKQTRDRYRAYNQMMAELGNKVGKAERVGQWLNTNFNTVFSTYEDARLKVHENNYHINQFNDALAKKQNVLEEIASLKRGTAGVKKASDDADFFDYTLKSDDLALSLIRLNNKLENNPLARHSSATIAAHISEMYDIASDNVDNTTKEYLIQKAFGANEELKSKPLTEEKKAELWEDIKENAKRFVDFNNDYTEAKSELIDADASLLERENLHLLNQLTELKAREKRIIRDVQELANNAGMSIDIESPDTLTGQHSEKHKAQLSIEFSKSIDAWKQAKEEAKEKIQKLEEKRDSGELLTLKDILEFMSSLATVIQADRAIEKLEYEQLSLNEAKDILLTADLLSTLNPILLNRMLTLPSLYTKEQLDEIAKLKQKIGIEGQVLVSEMAKLQDAYIDVQDALGALSIKEGQDIFKYLAYHLYNTRQSAGQRAINEVNIQNRFEKVRNTDPELLGITAAMWLNFPGIMDRFMQENEDLAPIVEPYKDINKAFTYLFSAASNHFKEGDPLNNTYQAIFGALMGLAEANYDYLRDNGTLGMVDLMQYLKDSWVTDVEGKTVIDSLQLSMMNAMSIGKVTVSFTEHLAKQQLKAQEEINKEADKEEKDLKEAPKKKRKERVKKKDNKQKKKDKKENKKEEGKSKSESEDTKEEKTDSTEEVKKVDTSPVKIEEDGTISTKGAKEYADDNNLPEIPVTADKSIPETPKLETIELNTEVHGTYFNFYDALSLKLGILKPYEGSEESLIHEWLKTNGIRLDRIIDDELGHILKTNPRILVMSVRKGDARGDKNVANNLFLVVEYNDKVAKHHNWQNGGVIRTKSANGETVPYLIIGTMWNTKAQDNTPVAMLMLTLRDLIQKRKIAFLRENNERFYVDPQVHTEVTDFFSGHIIRDVNDDTSNKPLSALIQKNNEENAANPIDYKDIGFGVIVESADDLGFRIVGPYNRQLIHTPGDKYEATRFGLVYALVPAANGEIIPIYINPVFLSELIDTESDLTRQIDDCIIRLMDLDYEVRKNALAELSSLLCLDGRISNNNDAKTILIGTKDIPTLSIVNNEATEKIKRFQLGTEDFQTIKEAIYKVLNPRVNVDIMKLSTVDGIKMYDEAGVLKTDAKKLGTYGAKLYIAPIDPATGLPIIPQKGTLHNPSSSSNIENSDYLKSRPTEDITTLYVANKKFVYRSGLWLEESKDGKSIRKLTNSTEDKALSEQLNWAYRVFKDFNNIPHAKSGKFNYYVFNVNSTNPLVIAYDTVNQTYYRAYGETVERIIANRREALERELKDLEAAKALAEAQLGTSNKEVKEEINSKKKAAEVVDEWAKDSEDYDITPDDKFYINKKTGQLRARVTSAMHADVLAGTERMDPTRGWATPSTSIGNSVDDFNRDFYDESIAVLNHTQYGNATPEAWLNYELDVKDTKDYILKKFEGKDLTFVSKKLVATGLMTVIKDGVAEIIDVAGTVDLVAYDKDGNFYIFDFKTKRGNISQSDIDKWTLQLSAYAELLSKKYGINVVYTGIIPTRVSYPTPVGEHTKAEGWGTTDYVETGEKGSGVHLLTANGKEFREANPRTYREETIENGTVVYGNPEYLIDIRPRKLTLSYNKLTDYEKALMNGDFTYEENSSIEGTDLMNGLKEEFNNNKSFSIATVEGRADVAITKEEVDKFFNAVSESNTFEDFLNKYDSQDRTIKLFEADSEEFRDFIEALIFSVLRGSIQRGDIDELFRGDNNVEVEVEIKKEVPVKGNNTPSPPPSLGPKTSYSVLDIVTKPELFEKYMELMNLITAKMLEAKEGKANKAWLDYNGSNLIQVLKDIGKDVDNIMDIDLWLSDIKTCK